MVKQRYLWKFLQVLNLSYIFAAENNKQLIPAVLAVEHPTIRATNMTKQEEIKTLQSLKGDTYFAQYFKDSDIDIMCENIRNDFAIEGGTEFHKESATLRQQLKDAFKTYKNKVRALVSDSIILAHDPEMEATFAGYIGKMELIKVKRENNIPLTNQEIDYLINAATENNQ